MINDTYRITTSGRKKKNNRIGEKFPKQLLTTGFAIFFSNFAVCRQGLLTRKIVCTFVSLDFVATVDTIMCFYAPGKLVKSKLVL